MVATIWNDCTMPSDCQVILVPVAMWQGDASIPHGTLPGGVTQPACHQPMQIIWAQTAPSADTGCYVVPHVQPTCSPPLPQPQPQLQYSLPQEQPTCSTPLPFEMSQEAKISHTLSDASNFKQRETRKPISSSTARRQRRQRAAERGAELAKPEGVSLSAQMRPDMRILSKTLPTGSCAPLLAGGGENAAIAKITRQLNDGGQARSAAIAAMRGNVWQLSQDAQGCRAVQLAMDVASSSDAKALVAELHRHVEEAVYSPHANYVIQKVIEAMPTTVSTFVAEELAGLGVVVARHRFGCRILCRLLEHSVASGAAAAAVIDECLTHAQDLCRHTFGHYVMKAILEHGTAEQRQRIACAIQTGPTTVQPRVQWRPDAQRSAP
mmetsp:Transcript_78550/g.202292  ORF Transcript_78550/g.202292 Transcript_78550/m.202292 type:complete len:380 (+) Transcript_78550:110-1249(+)